MKEKYAQAKEAAALAKEQIASTRKKGTQTSHTLEDYTGEFEHPAYGILSVKMNNNRLTATHNSIIYKLEHYHYDIFVESELGEVPEFVSFLTDTKGNITSLTFHLEPSVKEILFTRISEQKKE
ncbi:MAG: DUF3471 domain-containing protein [Scytonema sp. PMC 1069.18]|nr:DUF3471 domain-containing protein [Scytonema sp. PMC 1069.18]MEC4886874.1 DUF3471 domain-containing protein [Scytonema sp. PMC 1070.18]